MISIRKNTPQIIVREHATSKDFVVDNAAPENSINFMVERESKGTLHAREVVLLNIYSSS